MWNYNTDLVTFEYPFVNYTNKFLIDLLINDLFKYENDFEQSILLIPIFELFTSKFLLNFPEISRFFLFQESSKLYSVHSLELPSKSGKFLLQGSVLYPVLIFLDVGCGDLRTIHHSESSFSSNETFSSRWSKKLSKGLCLEDWYDSRGPG